MTLSVLIDSTSKGIMVSSIFVTSLFGWMLTKGAEQMVNSYWWELHPTVLYISESPINYIAILCSCIKNHRQLPPSQHFQNCYPEGETSDGWPLSSAGH
jgi:phosphatidate phosphatase APP1